ncbi:MAG: hypothetical protein L0Y72_22365 [Gemmataceae bacterium]|nr:hypothetical protein [Gemmataceae bacterium]MCI0741787.1 hypothetical protein [Gemmataceae bacterium]
MRPHRALFLLVAAALPPMAGCGGAQNPPIAAAQTMEEKLARVGALYHHYLADKEQPPASAEDLRAVQAHAADLTPVDAGDIVVVWGVKIRDDPQAGRLVLGYEKDAPKEGGFVLLVDGQVKKMSAAEFAAAPKAKR